MDKLQFSGGMRSTFFEKKVEPKSFPKDSWKISHFRLGDGIDLGILLSRYRVASLKWDIYF